MTFGGVEATVTRWSDTSIVCSVPAASLSPGEANVVATTAGGASNSASFAVDPGPAISWLAPTVTLPGAAVTISGTAFGATRASAR